MIFFYTLKRFTIPHISIMNLALTILVYIQLRSLALLIFAFVLVIRKEIHQIGQRRADDLHTI